ncbi:hypothetical protein [Clostridium butyricum]|jgi:hypothetical protein
MNKGIAIRNNKLRKNAKKRSVIKPEQENLCRFVTINYQVIERINGKFKRTGNKTENGLQIKNRVYLLNGKYKLVNNKGLRIKRKFETIPEWATDELIQKYKELKK